MDTNLMLKYRRARDCWLCPNCETENDMSLSACTLCGYKKNPSVPILRAWSPEQERLENMNRTVSGGSGIGGGRGMSSGPDIRTVSGMSGSEDSAPSSNKTNIVLILVAIFILIALFIGLSQ